MAGIYEVRAAFGGLEKPRRQAAAAKDYRAVRVWNDEFTRPRTVLS